MRRTVRRLLVPPLVAVVAASCGSDDFAESVTETSDGHSSTQDGVAGATAVAVDLDIAVDGSVQNPAWSPDGSELLVTVWRGGYNVGPADLVIVPIDGGEPRQLVADGYDNVNLPGSSWSPVTNAVTYSSTEDPHDEIWVISADGEGEPRRVTLHDAEVAYEPSFSPAGDAVVFELHPLDVEDEGRIARTPVGGEDIDNVAAEVFLTPAGEDCRQPNWSPDGDLIVFQCTEDGGTSWRLRVSSPDGRARRELETEGLNATDASFSPDGHWVVFSGDNGQDSADLWVVEIDGDELVRVTDEPGYEGAPSWSPDGARIAFEASDHDPDGHRTTMKILELDAPFTAGGITSTG